MRLPERFSGPFCGVLSDTHGVLRPEILARLAGADLLFHAGDVGSEAVLRGLSRIAPLYHVRGNCDGQSLAREWAWDVFTEWRGFRIGLTHDLQLLDLDPAAAGLQLLIHGHTHRPELREKDGVLYLNPGSAGTGNRPFSISCALFGLRAGRLDADILLL